MMYGFNNMYEYYILGISFLIVAAILVASDASKRGYNGAIWALIVIMMPMMGLFFYLIYISVSDTNNINSKHLQNLEKSTFNKQQQSFQASISAKGNLTGMYCTACGKLNHNDAMYCKYCGDEII